MNRVRSIQTGLAEALQLIETFGRDLTGTCSQLELSLGNACTSDLDALMRQHGISLNLLSAALHVKQITGRLNDMIHAVGMLVVLPQILEPGERIVSLSLASGNTGRMFDLETDRRVAEFKFIQWKGGPETIRQNATFVDLFNLIEHEAQRRRCLYVNNRDIVMKFFEGRRKIDSVLKRRPEVLSEFRDRHGNTFSVVCEYFQHVAGNVEIVDLRPYVPIPSAEWDAAIDPMQEE